MTAREFLVAHGRVGLLGRFRDAGDSPMPRGTQVVVRSRRGLELGEVLSASRPETATLPDEFVGEIVRIASLADRAAADRAAARANQLCDDAAAIAPQLALPFTALDAEIMLDGLGAILHGIHFAPCDLGPLLERLGDAHGLIVRLYDLSAEPNAPEAAVDHEESFKCDKPDCGEGDCSDCGDNGCNSCSAGGAKELSAYFAQLREQMERTPRLPLH